MAKQKVLPVRELFKFSPDDTKIGLTTDKTVLFEDGVSVFMRYRELVLLRFIMEVYTVIPEIKIVSKHNYINFYSNGIFTSKTINKAFAAIFEDVVNHYIKGKNSDRKILEVLQAKMYEVINNIYNNLSYEIPQYATSIDIDDLLDIQFNKELIDSMKEVYNNRGKEEYHMTVERVNKTYDILDKMLKTDPKVENNIISRGYRSGTFNQAQVKQLLASRGYLTEIDSNIFKYPIASSFTLGMVDIFDQAIESRSGARSLFLSTQAVKEAEYFARELQLITMIVEKLVDGDCGQKDYVDWYVRPKDGHGKADLPNLIGKYYYNEKTKKEEVITSNHTHLENTTIKLRSAVNCKLPDPTQICTKCFGELSYSIPMHSNIGHFCATSVTQKITQSILSTKHLSSSANSSEVHLDSNALLFFNVKSSKYYFNKDAKNKKTKFNLVISQFEAFGFKDIKTITDVRKLNPSRVSLIVDMILQVDKNGTGEYVDYPIHVKDNYKRGSFTYEFLEYCIANGYTLDKHDNYVISLDKWDFNKPLIAMPELEYNFLALAKNVKSIFKKISILKDEFRSTDTPEALVQKVFDCLNVKLDINITIIEVICYAFTVKSIKDKDYSLGRNCPDRQLMKSSAILANRSLGAGYGWEFVTDLILSPRSFDGKNKVSHPMDIMIKPNEVILDKYPNK